MRIKLTEETSEGMVIEIIPTSYREAIEIGQLSEKLKSLNKCFWFFKDFLRIPIVSADNLGMPKIQE